MVALSFPRSFAIRPSGPDDRLTPFPPFSTGADFIDASYEYSPLYGPFYSNYYYSPYFFSPFGYSYLRYYGATAASRPWRSSCPARAGAAEATGTCPPRTGAR
jgi:hypothetical protein